MALGAGAVLVAAAGRGSCWPARGWRGLAARQGVTHLTVPPAVLAGLDPGTLATVAGAGGGRGGAGAASWRPGGPAGGG